MKVLDHLRGAAGTRRLGEREDIARIVDVERELAYTDHRRRDVGLRGRLEMTTIRIQTEPRGDGAGRTAQQEVRSGVVGRRGEDDGPECVEGPREHDGCD